MFERQLSEEKSAVLSSPLLQFVDKIFEDSEHPACFRCGLGLDGYQPPAVERIRYMSDSQGQIRPGLIFQANVSKAFYVFVCSLTSGCMFEKHPACFRCGLGLDGCECERARVRVSVS